MFVALCRYPLLLKWPLHVTFYITFSCLLSKLQKILRRHTNCLWHSQPFWKLAFSWWISKYSVIWRSHCCKTLSLNLVFYLNLVITPGWVIVSLSPLHILFGIDLVLQWLQKQLSQSTSNDFFCGCVNLTETKYCILDCKTCRTLKSIFFLML